MSLLSWLFSAFRRPKVTSSEHLDAFLVELSHDLTEQSQSGREVEGIASLQEAVDAGQLVVIDWADEPEVVVEEVLSLGGDIVSLVAAGEAVVRDVTATQTNKNKRGARTYPCILALDDALVGSGRRLLWVDEQGDGYLLCLVSDSFHARWHDVVISSEQKLTALAVTTNNEAPRRWKLDTDPRPTEGVR